MMQSSKELKERRQRWKKGRETKHEEEQITKLTHDEINEFRIRLNPLLFFVSFTFFCCCRIGVGFVESDEMLLAEVK